MNQEKRNRPCNKPPYFKKIAQQIRNKRGRGKKAQKLRIYQCPVCDYWHLTHQTKAFELIR
jgi:hypothetical protein